ncbi:MAG: family 1 glycosylhydrolase [Succinivibrio sp.]|nr:family 1 glycosylhydrolase [Succinivibrio sp.]
MKGKFKANFMWGAASAAAQVEGGYLEDGRGLSLWDVLYEGHTAHNESPHEACDHYHRMREDVALMAELGLKYYRFSISWSRVLPEGTGKVNQQGLQFYKDLVHELKAHGIEPLITLYHWDLPYELYKKGGWQNPESVDWFCAYTKTVIDALSDEVSLWLTFNEPNCFIGISYKDARHAPFLDDKAALIPCTRHVLLAHAKAVQLIRENAKLPPKIGFAPTGPVYKPADLSAAAIEEARRLTFSNTLQGPFSVGWWIDPVVLGQTPRDVEDYLCTTLFSPSELELLKQPLDFLGFNLYLAAGFDVEGSAYQSNEYQGCPRNSLGWPIDPDCMYWAIRFLQDRYKLPLLITENGMCNNDFVMLDGKVHDPQRIDYIHRHLLKAQQAVSEGYDLIGYMYWSIMDNYEWAEGYDPRFGLIYVDYRDQKRILKDSALWYSEVIKSNGACL